MARSYAKYWLLKETLEVICFYQTCTLIDAMVIVYFSFLKPIMTGNSHAQLASLFADDVMVLLLLPFLAKKLN